MSDTIIQINVYYTIGSSAIKNLSTFETYEDFGKWYCFACEKISLVNIVIDR